MLTRHTLAQLVALGALACSTVGCSDDAGKADAKGGSGGKTNSGGGNTSSGGGKTSGGGTNPGSGGQNSGGSGMGTPPSSTPDIPVPDGGIEAKPTETDLPLSEAADLGTIKYIPNRSSVVLYLPGGIDGVRDYRVFAVEDGVKVMLHDGLEHVAGATISCAGTQQRNQCDESTYPIDYHNEDLDMPTCGGADRRPGMPRKLMQTLEVDGVKPDSTLVVEAIDTMCPFPGLWGTFHHDETLGASDIGGPMADVVVNGKSYSIKRREQTFSMFTEEEIRKTYDSMILNGQGPNLPSFDPSSPDFPQSPYIHQASPAPAIDPKVLARSVVKVSPLGTAKPIDGFTADDYFDDFDDDKDQPKKIRDKDPLTEVVGMRVALWQTKKWNLYDIANGFNDFFISRGQLNMIFADPSQGSMSLQAIYPKRAVKLPTDDKSYLRVTYEVQRNETPRRYDNFSLCGSDKMGDTYDGESPKAAPGPRPGFMNDMDTARDNAFGWNCLLLVPRGPGYGPMDGGDTPVRSHPDSSLKITVIKAHPAPTAATYDNERIGAYAKGFGPVQDTTYPRQYFREVDDKGKIAGLWLDDELNVWQKTRFDVFVRRDRVVIYVKGKQKICQNLTDSPLTMAEGALGWWHVLYHSSAEFLEIRGNSAGANPSSLQSHLMHNTPWADQRAYDNIGFKEDVALPDDFDDARCLD